MAPVYFEGKVTLVTGGASGLLIPEPHQWSDPETFVDLERASLERWRYLDQVTPGGPECEDVEIGDAHAVELLIGSPARAMDGVFFPAAPGRTLGAAASA